MTRINLTHPALLSDSHLVAEWNEAPRCITRAEARHAKDGTPGKIPPRFTLGEGHESFFYDKLDYIIERLYNIRDEMFNRGMSPSSDLLASHISRVLSLPQEFRHGFTPSTSELWLSRARLYKRDPDRYQRWKDELFSGKYKAAYLEVHSHD